MKIDSKHEKCKKNTHNEQTKPRINIARNQEQSKAK